MNWWVSTYLEYFGPAFVISWIFWVIASVVLHELSHGWMALRAGDTTPVDSGHMTLNPMVHMGGFSLVVFALCGIAWGAMPVNPSRFRRRKDEAMVALAGPGMNLVLAFICVVGGSLWIVFSEGASDHMRRNLTDFFLVGAKLNIVLMIFNLLPIPPLDGSSIVSTYSQGFRNFIRSPNFGMIGMIVFLVVFVKGAGPLFSFATKLATWSIGTLAGVFGGA